MGLDITAFSTLVVQPDYDPATVDLDDTVVEISQEIINWTEKNWPGRTAGLVAGICGFSAAIDFAAGSYGGYNRWRDRLAKLAGFPDADTVWRDSPQGPFVELINFADNEGYIGPVVAAKLAVDFAAYRTLANEVEIPGFAERYSYWHDACLIAANGGCLVFR